jgi:hypothetical protein
MQRKFTVASKLPGLDLDLTFPDRKNSEKSKKTAIELKALKTSRRCNLHHLIHHHHHAPRMQRPPRHLEFNQNFPNSQESRIDS